jgi:hypothetical protein
VEIGNLRWLSTEVHRRPFDPSDLPWIVGQRLFDPYWAGVKIYRVYRAGGQAAHPTDNPVDIFWTLTFRNGLPSPAAAPRLQGAPKGEAAGQKLKALDSRGGGSSRGGEESIHWSCEHCTFANITGDLIYSVHHLQPPLLT